MFQGDWGMLHQQEKWAVRGKLRIAHFCILYIQMPCLLMLFFSIRKCLFAKMI